MNDDRQNELTIVVGRKGSGKSSAAAELVKDHPRRLYIDPMRCFTDGVIIHRYADLVAYLKPLIHSSRYSAVFRSLSDEDMLAAIHLPTANGNPEAPPMPGAIVVIDEVDKWCNSQSAPESIRNLANYGRHFNVSAVFIARRAAEIPKTIRAMADRYVIGHTFDPGDVAALEEFIGPEKAEEVRAIPAPVPGTKPIMVEWP